MSAHDVRERIVVGDARQGNLQDSLQWERRSRRKRICERDLKARPRAKRLNVIPTAVGQLVIPWANGPRDLLLGICFWGPTTKTTADPSPAFGGLGMTFTVCHPEGRRPEGSASGFLFRVRGGRAASLGGRSPVSRSRLPGEADFGDLFSPGTRKVTLAIRPGDLLGYEGFAS